MTDILSGPDGTTATHSPRTATHRPPNPPTDYPHILTYGRGSVLVRVAIPWPAGKSLSKLWRTASCDDEES